MLRNIPVLRPNPGELYSGPMHSNAVSHSHIKQMYPKTALLPDSLSLSFSFPAFFFLFVLRFCLYQHLLQRFSLFTITERASVSLEEYGIYFICYL